MFYDFDFYPTYYTPRYYTSYLVGYSVGNRFQINRKTAIKINANINLSTITQ